MEFGDIVVLCLVSRCYFMYCVCVCVRMCVWKEESETFRLKWQTKKYKIVDKKEERHTERHGESESEWQNTQQERKSIEAYTLTKFAAASKSMSLIFCPICIIFDGLMSPWMKPLLWTNLRAKATCFVILLISSHSVPNIYSKYISISISINMKGGGKDWWLFVSR